MSEAYGQLKQRLEEYFDLRAAYLLLNWDMNTKMPPGGGPARARQISRLQRMAHERLTDPALGALLDELEPWAEAQPPDSQEAGLVRAARRSHDAWAPIPADLMGEISQHSAQTFEVWRQARPADDFAIVRPHLEKTVALSQEAASHYPEAEHPIDPFIALFDPGMTAASVSALFDELREALVPLVEAIASEEAPGTGFMRQPYPVDRQLAFGEEVIRRFGYDFERGRQDFAPHPFMTRFSIGDVRITTRAQEDDPTDALFSTLHEAGHAMYEQGVDPAFEGTLLARGASAGLHESQSRLWENIVGRSRGFWTYFYPRLQETFPEQLNGVPLDDFYRAVNRVERSLIRTDADEVTYNLHVMMRFSFEMQLLEGSLEVRHLPEAWKARMEADLGIAPTDDKDGVLQDVHWFSYIVGGMFQGYTLGNIMSAQIYQAALETHPEIPDDIEQGRFETLHGWLKENIYRHGRKYTPDMLIERATGRPLSLDAYLQYLREKYGGLYNL